MSYYRNSIIDYKEKILSKIAYFYSEEYIIFNRSEQYISLKIFNSLNKNINCIERHFRNIDKDKIKYFQPSEKDLKKCSNILFIN